MFFLLFNHSSFCLDPIRYFFHPTSQQARTKVDATSFKGIFSRPSADLTNSNHITSQSSLSFDLHERLYTTLGENCRILDVDDSLVESFTSADGLPFIAIEAPHLSTHRQVKNRFVCVTTKALHIYKQPSPDDDDDKKKNSKDIEKDATTRSNSNSKNLLKSPNEVIESTKKVPLVSLEVVGAVPVSQRILSMALFGENQEHIVVLTSHNDGCVFIYLDLIRQINMHEGVSDERWGKRQELGNPSVVCGSSISNEIILINSIQRSVICYDTTGNQQNVLLQYDSDVVVTAAMMDSNNYLNVAFRNSDASNTTGSRIDVYGCSPIDTNGNESGSGSGKKKLNLLWRFNDDGLAPFGIPVALCVGGNNNVVVLDNRDIPFPNIISWDTNLISEKLLNIKQEEQNSKLSNVSDNHFHFRENSDRIHFPTGTYGIPLNQVIPSNFISLWKNGKLKARKNDLESESNTYVVVPGYIRLRTWNNNNSNIRTVSPFSTSYNNGNNGNNDHNDHNDNNTTTNQTINLSLACAYRLVRDDGYTTQWRTTKYVRVQHEMTSTDAIFNFSDNGFLTFDEDEVIDATGFSIQMELRGRSGMNSCIMGTLQLPGTCVSTMPPTLHTQQQYDLPNEMNVEGMHFNLSKPGDERDGRDSSIEQIEHIITATMNIYVEPNMLLIKNSFNKGQGAVGLVGNDVNNQLQNSIRDTSGTKRKEEIGQEKKEDDKKLKYQMLNRKSHGTSVSFFKN